jgi:cytochrome c oxidase subunit 1
MFGKMMNPILGYIHFWITFIGVYLIFFPMHFIGLAGFPRRYYSFTIFETFSGFTDLNKFISIAAFLTFAAQGIFLYNFFKSIFWGKPASVNPWKSNTLEWTTPAHRIHGNWIGEVPKVYRWPYDYSVENEPKDYIPQNQPPMEVIHPKSARV